VDIWESLQGLTFEAKAAIAIPTAVATILWVASEIRHEIRHRADQQRIARYEATDLREKRAIIDLERPRSQNRGAAMILGTVETTGSKAGQHFTGLIKNAGPHFAEGIRVTGSFGGMGTQTITAPTILQPHSAAEPIDLMVPMVPNGVVTYDDIMDMLHAGDALQVQIDFVDGTPAPEPLYRCFVFRLEDVGGMNWVSHPVSCFAPPEDPASHQT
jgi:hypothetical protein